MLEALKNKITHGDSFEILKQLPDKCIDLVLTDPPYRDEKDNAPTQDMRKNSMIKSFGNRPSKEFFDEIFRVSKNQIIFGANNFELPPYKGFIVWNKGIAFDFTMSMAELAFINEGLGTISKIYNVRASGQGDRIHPTQKPLELFERILRDYTSKLDPAGGGLLIADFFSGSGTTAVACHNLGLDFIAVEKDEEYFKSSSERLKNAQAQMKLFTEF